jgi:hypothetical protein
MQEPFDSSYLSKVMILKSQGSDGGMGRCCSRFLKRVERLLFFVGTGVSARSAFPNGPQETSF